MDILGTWYKVLFCLFAANLFYMTTGDLKDAGRTDHCLSKWRAVGMNGSKQPHTPPNRVEWFCLDTRDLMRIIRTMNSN